MKLSVKLKPDNSFKGSCTYKNEINGENFKELAQMLRDLRFHNAPIDKAIKEYNRGKSDWDSALPI